MKRIKIIVISLILVFGNLCTVNAEVSAPLVTNSKELLNAISRAEEGATILVGDIDFTPDEGVSNEFARVKLGKSVNIRSGYKKKNAVFTNVSFVITGSKSAGEELVCSFEGISFDGGAVSSELIPSDWELQYSDDGQAFSEDPVKSRFAVKFGGNVDASFDGCSFSNYMYEYGPVFYARYGDYTANPTLLSMFGDWSGCNLNISLSDCEISGNSARYGGGAVYLEGNNNICFTASNCSFTGNLSCCGDFSEGGGACLFRNADAVLIGCSFTGNEANHDFGLGLADTDLTQGGAVCSLYGTLNVLKSDFADNRASLGGAIRVLNTDTVVSECSFSRNSASSVAVNPEGESGPWSGMGMGGAMYVNTDPSSPVSIYSSEIKDNSAEFGYGSIYGFYTNEYASLMPLGLGSIDLYLCDTENNSCETKYDYSGEIFPWASHPGDILDIEYLKMHGCIFIDEMYESDFERREQPSDENGYNYIASVSEAKKDGFKKKDLKVPKELSSAWIPENNAVIGGADGPTSVRLSSGNPLILVLPAAVTVALILYFRSKRKTNNENSALGPEIFSGEEIEALRNDIELRQLLTPRELELMCEYISGNSRAALAEKLSISEATAKTHISNIYSKLNVKNKNELVKKLKNR